MTGDGGVPTTAERLGRMLVIVPYLVRHPGTDVAEAARLFDVPQTQLRRDLSLLMMSGVPPYGPGDLIDVDIDEDDQIWIRMADHFARPLRLTRAEATAVRIRAAELAATPGVPEAPDLTSAIAEIDAALGDAPIEAVATSTAPPFLETVRDAAAGKVSLRVGYVAGSTGERTDRVVDPEAVFAEMGNWYVVVWDHGADDERLLRVDRIVEAVQTGDAFEPRGLEGAGRPLYQTGTQDLEVVLDLGPSSRWVAEYYSTTSVEELGGGVLRVTLPTKDLAWLARLLLRLGTDTVVRSPDELRDRRNELARRTLAAYRDQGTEPPG